MQFLSTRWRALGALAQTLFRTSGLFVSSLLLAGAMIGAGAAHAQSGPPAVGTTGTDGALSGS